MATETPPRPGHWRVVTAAFLLRTPSSPSPEPRTQKHHAVAAQYVVIHRMNQAASPQVRIQYVLFCISQVTML